MTLGLYLRILVGRETNKLFSIGMIFKYLKRYFLKLSLDETIIKIQKQKNAEKLKILLHRVCKNKKRQLV